MLLVKGQNSTFLQTLVLGARPAISAAAAFPALFSSIKLMVELMRRRVTIPTKSCQSGGLPYKRKMKKVFIRFHSHTNSNLVKG